MGWAGLSVLGTVYMTQRVEEVTSGRDGTECCQAGPKERSDGKVQMRTDRSVTKMPWFS